MNSEYEKLAVTLAARGDELWDLHLAALQFVTEGAPPALASRLADDLDRLRRVLEAETPAEIRGHLGEAIRGLRCADGARVAEPLLRLVDALVALQRGEGSGALAVVLSQGPARPAPGAPPAPERGEDREDQLLFAAEAREHVREVEARLLEIERTRDLSLVAEVFRGVHSIKGGAQYLGLEAMSQVAHRAETLLDRLRSGRLALSGVVVSALLRAVDVLSKTVAALERGEEPAADTGSTVHELERLAAGQTIEVEALGTGGGSGASPEDDRSRIAPAASPRPDDAGDKELFVTEFRENLRSASALLRDVAHLVVSPPDLVTASRNLHSLKGLAGLAGLPDMERLAGAIDTAVNRAVREGAAADGSMQSACDAAIVRLATLFSDYEAKGGIVGNVDEEVDALARLAPGPSAPSTFRRPLTATGPLAGQFSALVASFDSADRAATDSAFAALARAAELQGCDEVVSRVRALRAEWASHGSKDVLPALQGLAPLLPADLPGAGEGNVLAPVTLEAASLAVPGIGTKKLKRLVEAGIDSLAAVRRAGLRGLLAVPGIGVEQARMLLANATEAQAAEEPPRPSAAAIESADFAREVLGDAHDRSLVQIYLATAARQASEAVGRLRDGDDPGGRRIVSDLAASARYMRYEPLADTFESALAMLRAASPDVAAATALLAAARQRIEGLERQAEAMPPAAGAASREVEASELERIFRESAEAHLGAVLRHLTDFVLQMDEGRLGSLQHHLSCLHSAATNVGRESAAAAAGRLQSGVEELWLSPAAVDRASVAGLFALLRGLFEASGLEAPVVDIPTPPARPVAAATAATAATAPGALADLVDSLAEAAAVDAPPRLGEEPARVDEPPAPLARDVRARDSIAEGTEIPSDRGLGEATAATDPAEAARALVEAQTTLRVDTAKIDDLMNMVAELVVNRSAFMVLGSTVNDLVGRLVASGQAGKGEARDLRTVLTRYDEAMTELGRVSNQLQQGVMRIRMMPVRTLFSRIPRLVRDLALREHREVTVAFSGEDTELDKTVIERLSDPLVHLIRNAIGHGIEAPEERRAAGKPPEGRLRLSARHQGNIVILEVEDDGRGVDFERIRRRFTEAGLGSAAQASRLSHGELLAALFLPGFSTADRVSDVSGRGVGLDVVKRNIESLGGQVDATSEPGRFSRFTIRIPLTMAIMQALLVRVADETYAIPVAAVIQAERITRSRIYSVESQKAITIRDSVIPLVELEEIFAYNYYLETGQGGRPAPGSPPPGPTGGDAGSAYVVVVQGEGREIGIVVNELVGTQDIVIKSLEDELADGRGVAGASILGDGTVTLILDIGEIQKMLLDGQHSEDLRRSETLRRLERWVSERGLIEAERTVGPLAWPAEPLPTARH